MKLKIVQTGDPVLRKQARALSTKEILSPAIQRLIKLMKDTMQDAPGVGLAAPQIGESLQLAVIEDPPEYTRGVPPELLKERERSPVPLHVIINPKITVTETEMVAFHEGCLSITGFLGLVPRARSVTVECLNEHAQPVVIKAHGWYARILQHEIDHLNGKLFIDRMKIESFTTVENYGKY